jgi:hypothetical protein
MVHPESDRSTVRPEMEAAGWANQRMPRQTGGLSALNGPPGVGQIDGSPRDGGSRVGKSAYAPADHSTFRDEWSTVGSRKGAVSLMAHFPSPLIKPDVRISRIKCGASHLMRNVVLGSDSGA